MKFSKFKDRVENIKRMGQVFHGKYSETHYQAKALLIISKIMMEKEENKRKLLIRELVRAVVNAAEINSILPKGMDANPNSSGSIKDITINVITGAYRASIKSIAAYCINNGYTLEECL